ncbi:MAG TPA: NAD(P)/FAD-dependent oxidoreductase [Caulobacteraceae bacterium]|jgi:thioredoxin reductase (NADPH)
MPATPAPEPFDCLIIGGGPAGLTAAVYLARFRRRLRLLDAGASRAAWIPRSHNLPGYPAGAAGEQLLQALRDQLAVHGGQVEAASVEGLRSDPSGFAALTGGAWITARTILLATGVAEIAPPIPRLAEAIRRGEARVCPICDGFEAQGQSVAVIGRGDHAAREALFLRTWSPKVSLVLDPEDSLPADMAHALESRAVAVLRSTWDRVTLTASTALIVNDAGETHRFDLLYSAFGITPRLELVRDLAPDLDADGRLVVDSHQQTSVAGLYAAGDIVRGLNQIAVAEGEAAVAATAIHNRLPPNPCARETPA